MWSITELAIRLYMPTSLELRQVVAKVLYRDKPLVMEAILVIPPELTFILKSVIKVDLSALGLFYHHPKRNYFVERRYDER